MKSIAFLGDSLDSIRDFPADVRSDAGYQLHVVQEGHDPNDWKPMKSVGPGVREVRFRDGSGAYRIIYLASVADVVVVLHAFQKKTRATSMQDIALAASRLRLWRQGR